MISFNRLTKVFVSKEPTDMRASYDTLFAKVKGVLNQDPYAGHLFVFINSRRNCIKCLFWDGTGLVLLCKRINEGLFYKHQTVRKCDRNIERHYLRKVVYSKLWLPPILGYNQDDL